MSFKLPGKLTTLGLIIAAMTLWACAGPGGPSQPDGDRRGPPPFTNLDLNTDGQLTLDEFQTHKIPHGDHAEVFDKIDSDGDGVVTQTEYESHRPPDRPPRPDRD